MFYWYPSYEIAVVLSELASSLWKYWYFLLIVFFLDDIKDTISKLNSLVFKAKLPHLWSEAAIIKRVVYRNGNQHRKQFYFQGLKRVLSWLNCTYEINTFHSCSWVLFLSKTELLSLFCIHSYLQIVKSLSRLRETEIYNKMIDLRNTFPRYTVNLQLLNRILLIV